MTSPFADVSAHGLRRAVVPALTAVMLLVTAFGASLRWLTVTKLGLVGTDLDFYRVVGQRFLETGSQYLPLQLAGRYDSQPLVPLDVLPSLYPPPALFLFLPFVVLPALLWWAIPLAVTGYAMWRWRPARWTWLILAACLAWPETTIVVMVGNTTMWAVAAISAGLLVGWPAALLVIKPTFLPFALVGVGRRSFWVALAAILFLTIPLLPEWGRWLTALANGTAGASYSVGSYPAAAIPIIAWLGRRATAPAASSGDRVVAGLPERAPGR